LKVDCSAVEPGAARVVEPVAGLEEVPAAARAAEPVEEPVEEPVAAPGEALAEALEALRVPRRPISPRH
jgi:hypothetical protein